MTEMLGPYDPASPSVTTFCSRISSTDYEKEGSDYTNQALAQLIEYLEYNPTAYHNVLRKRKRDEAQNAGVFSWLKVKMLSSMFGEEYCEHLSDEDLRKNLTSLKSEMVSSYNYAEEAKGSGRRLSKRLANKIKPKETVPPLQTENEVIKKSLEFELWTEANNTKKQTPQTEICERLSRKEGSRTSLIPKPPKLSCEPPPPPPPPPPPLPTVNLQTRCTLPKVNEMKKCEIKTSLAGKTKPEKQRPITTSENSLEADLMTSLKNPQVRAALKPVRNKEFTPYQLRQRAKQKDAKKEKEFPLFNQELIAKFQNARSPDTPDNSKYMSDVSSPDSFIASL